MIKAQTLKGFRDFLPTDAIKRQNVIEKIRTVFERFGFDPLETPALEYAETLLGKYGEQADKLLYTFQDRGGRRVGMRYDQTVPLSRVIAQYPNLPKPFKRYQIQPVWRAENTQKGRYREFLQCDADIVGIKSHTADAEILALFAGCFETLNIDYVLYINSREALFSLLKGVVQNDESLWLRVLQSIDKLDKKSEEEVREELLQKKLTQQEVNDILWGVKNSAIESDEWLRYVKQIATTNFGVSESKIQYKPTLVRGLDYYTGIIFEAGLSNGGSSLGGGGRYDKLIGQFSGVDTPAVGFALGFDRILDVLPNNPKGLTNTKVFVATIPENDDVLGENPIAFNLVQELRKAEINSELNLDTQSKLEKQLRFADKKGIPFVIIQGRNELDKGVVLLKDMKSRASKEVKLEEVIKTVKEFRGI